MSERETDRRDVGTDDPAAIRSIAVTTDDVVTALEANRRCDQGAVLRITPPFNGRMRARLHLDGGEGAYEGSTDPIHVDPERLVADAPPYPEVDETEDELRAADAYTPERHRERHQEAVEDWRAAIRDDIVDTVTVETATATHRIEVKPLG